MICSKHRLPIEGFDDVAFHVSIAVVEGFLGSEVFDEVEVLRTTGGANVGARCYGKLDGASTDRGAAAPYQKRAVQRIRLLRWQRKVEEVFLVEACGSC